MMNLCSTENLVLCGRGSMVYDVTQLNKFQFQFHMLEKIQRNIQIYIIFTALISGPFEQRKNDLFDI
jgi:hypothetical protein